MRTLTPPESPTILRLETLKPSPLRHTIMASTLSIAFAVLSFGLCAAAQQIPPIHGTTFAGTQVDLPADLHGKTGILVVGFTQGSRDAVTLWGKRLSSGYDKSLAVVFYEMPVLASVPRFLRGFVTGRIKSAVSDPGKPHFLPILDREADWRQLVHYTDSHADDAYILVVDQTGSVRWQAQGPPTDATCAALIQQIRALNPGTKP